VPRPSCGQCLSAAFERLDRDRAALAAQVVASARQPDPDIVPGGMPDLKNQWRQSEQAFITFRERTCDAILTAAIEGSWRSIQTVGCMLRLTHEHIAFLRDAKEGKGV
jgi:uncharacterized protein YecT (DUF1311 family)